MSLGTQIATGTLRRRSGVVIGVATVCAFYTLAITPAGAIDIDGTDYLITETVAGRERLKDYDDIKKYGAERVSDRDRQHAQPDGIRAGNYLVFPSAGATLIYDDNIFRSDANKVSDWRSELTPAVKLQSQLPRHVLDFSLDGKIVNHLENTDQDYANVRAKLDGALHFDHAHTISATVIASLDHEERGELTWLQPGEYFTLDPATDPDRFRRIAAEPIPVFHNQASIGITRDVGRLYGTLMATFKRWDYADVMALNGERLDQDFRDTEQFSTALRFGYRFSPGFEFVGKVRALRDLNRGGEIDGRYYDRDAYGWEVMAGLAFETSPLLRWRILGGYGIRDFDQGNLDDVATALLEAQVQWLPTQYITVTGFATRQILAADSVEPSGRIETRIGGRLDYEIWHNTVMNFGLELREAEFIGTARHDQTIAGRVGIDYHMNKNWTLSAAYERAMRQSTEDALDMTRNRFIVGAKLRF